MAEQTKFGLSGPNILLLAGFLVIAAAIYIATLPGQDTGQTAQDTAQVELAEPASDEAVEAETAPNVETVASDDAAQDPPSTTEDTAEAKTTPEAEAKPVEPSFDLVRVDPTGDAVIAGQAEPGTSVRLLADGEVMAETVADDAGKFVALFDLPPSAEPRSLSAESETTEGEVVASGGTILIAPTRSVETAALSEELVNAGEGASAPETATQPEKPAASRVEDAAADTSTSEPKPVSDTELASVSETPVPAAEAPAPEVPSTEAATVEREEPVELTASAEGPLVVAEPDTPASPAIVLADDTGVTVLQPAPQPTVAVGGSPDVVANLVIDTITYDQLGEVALGGRGAANSFARIYVNDQPIETVQIAQDGSWATPLPDIDAGVYRLRVDEVDAGGRVTSRVETPFQREAPEVAAQAIQRPNAVTVQEGFTLWAIAKDRFGSGVDYVRVYEANRDLIRDPDLIYPGQVFELPEG